MKKKLITCEEDVEQIKKHLGELDLDKKWEVEIKPFKFSRSSQQNKRYWKLIEELASYLGYDDQEMHELMKYKFLSYKQDMLGDEMVVVKSTTKLTIKEFVEYTSKVEQFAFTLGFKLQGSQYDY